MSTRRSETEVSEQALSRTLRLTPSPYVDLSTPWVMPYDATQKVVASGFWLSFGVSSTVLHLMGLALALGAMPFALSVCALFSTVKPIDEKPAPVVVEMAVVKVPPPPPPEPPPPPPPPPEPLQIGRRRAAVARELEVQSGLLAILGTTSSSSFDNVLSSDEVGVALGGLMGVEGGVEGGVVGGVVGGVGGGGTAEGVGLGGLGSIGHRAARTTVASCVRRLLPALRGCVAASTRLSLRVSGGVVTGVDDNACASDVVSGVACDVDDGVHSLALRK